MKKFLQNVFRRSRREEALTKKEAPDDTAQNPTNSHIISPICPISPIVSGPSPVSEDVTRNSTIEKDGPTAVPSPGGEGKGEGEQTSAEGAYRPDHALVGKIARLPGHIREEVNQRLLDGKEGPEILPWLNELPAVKEVLAAHFDGKPITKQNLCHWRQLGFQRWRTEKQDIVSAEKLGEYAGQFTKAAGGRFAPAVAAAVCRKLFEFLSSAEQISPDDLVRYAAAAFALLKGEQNNTKLELARERIRQKDEMILITRDKFQRDCVGLIMRALGDARAKEIYASGFNNEEKIEAIGYHLYDDLWEPRHIPTPEDFNQPPTP